MKIEDLFKKLKPISGSDMGVLWQEYVLADTKTRKNIEDSLRIVLAKNLSETFEGKEILLEPPPKEIAQGEYPLGFVHYKERLYPFGMREDEWVQHLGIFGRSGSGKTNVGLIAVLNLLARSKPFLIFDWKRNYRDLLSLGLEDAILVFTAGRDVCPFYFNPLIPPAGTPPRIWLKKVTEIMGHAYFLGEGVSYLMQKALDSVYQEFGVYGDSPQMHPTLLDVKEWLENYKTKGRESAWMDSALRAVGVLCFGEMGRVLNQRRNLPLERLLEKNVILELDALTSSDKTFLIESLLLWVHHFRMAQGDREQFKHAIVIEEAHHILMRKKQEVMGEEAVTDILLREIRELGESVILLDQHPSLISKPALGNTYCTIAMNLKHRADIKMISDCLLMDAAQMRYIGRLEVGSALVKLQGRWYTPFFVKFPLLRLQKGAVTDKKLRERMAGFYKGISAVVRGKEGISGGGRKERPVFRPIRGAGKGAKGKTEKLAKAEQLLLRNIVKDSCSSTTDRYRRLGLNAYQGNKARQSLISERLIEVKDMATPTGRVKLLELTNRGKGMAESLGLNPNPSFRHGGPEHQYWKKRMAEHYRNKGYRVAEEYPIGQGKAVDLVAMKDGERIAIEVETGKSDAVYNIRKDLEAGFDRVVCFCLDGKEAERIKKLGFMEKAGIAGKVMVCSLEDFDR